MKACEHNGCFHKDQRIKLLPVFTVAELFVLFALLMIPDAATGRSVISTNQALSDSSSGQHQAGEPDQFPAFLMPGLSYKWPTDASDYFSATFAETRSAHFHSAADIGTWGREGHDVFATRDGLLFRAGVSARGYGNVVYLQHDDGSYSVYAHLQDFAPSIRAVVDSTRFKTYTQSYDQIVADAGIRFQQGDVIGRTGSTGIGPPHLHFEIRSSTNTAVNPKLVGITIADSVPPRFSSLAVLPLSADAYANDSKDIQRLRPTQRGEVYDFGRVETEGTIGLAVNASDRSDSGRNVYAVYELIMTVNGEPYFHSKVDSFAMSDSRQMLIDRVYPLLLDRQGGYQRLHIEEGNTLPFYKREQGDGKLRLPPGSHQVEILARDFEGNEARAKLRLDVNETRALPLSDENQNDDVVNSVAELAHPEDQFRWTKSWIAPRSLAHHEVKSHIIGDFGREETRYGKLSAHEAITLRGQSIGVESRETGFFSLHRIVPGQRRRLKFPEQKLSLDFAADAAYDTLYVHVNRFLFADGDSLRDRVRIAPENTPLQGTYELTLVLPDSLAGKPDVGLYFVNQRRDRLDYMDSSIHGNVLKAEIEGFGTFEIRRDTTAPELNRPRLWQRQSDGQWFVSVHASDADSGVDYDNAFFEVNGRRGIAEYDPFGERMHYHQPSFIPLCGANDVRLRVTDYAGNVTEKRFEVDY